MTARQAVALDINGETRDLLVRVDETLLEVLREQLALTGAKRGCNQGVCGACTALRDGQPVRGCLTLAIDAQGHAWTTIEGLATGGELSPLQRAFVAKSAPQCGFCMSGMVLAAKAFLDEHPRPDVDAIREGLSGNLCRCTGYVKVIDAVLAVARGEFA